MSHSARLSFSPGGNGLAGPLQWCLVRRGDGAGMEARRTRSGCRASRLSIRILQASIRSPPPRHILRRPGRPCRTALRPIRPPSCGASAGVSGFSPCSISRSDLPIGISGTPTRRGEVREVRRCADPNLRTELAQPHARIPSSVRRPRVNPTTTTKHACLPQIARLLVQARILGHDRGLAARPPMRYMLKRELLACAMSG